jgi:phosphohistidine swiveling domain-containing protein
VEKMNDKMIFTEDISQEVLEKIKTLNWYRHGIYTTNIFQSSYGVMRLGQEWFKEEWIDKGFLNIVYLGSEVFITENELEEFSDIMFNKINTDQDYLKKYIKKYREDNKSFLEDATRIGNEFDPEMSNEDLSGLLVEFLESSSKTFHWLWSMEFLNPAIDKFIRINVKKHQPTWSEEEVDNFLTAISHTSKKLPFQIEKEESLKIDFEDLETIKDMHKRFAWLNMYFWDGHPFTFEEYKSRLLKMAKDDVTKRDVEEFNNKSLEADALIQGVGDKNLREILKIIQDLIFLKTERIDVYTISCYKIFNILKEICKRLDLSRDQLLTFTRDEILSFLKGQPIPNDIKKREKFGCAVFNGKVSFIYGEAYDNLKNIFKKDFTNIKEMKGAIGYKGVARGTARVLMNEKDLYKLQKGDILVCNLTNPNYNPAFEKITGIVTDEGGILCHSAIMAREFKLPCVINTKIATRVIKDGDLVEVDADKGFVRVLERKDG